MTRKLATIRTISAINEHGNADSLEVAVIDGWNVVIRKGEYKAGDVVVFCEIDSWLPTAVAPFLTKPGKEPKEFSGVKGERLRTARLRGVLSQGLVLPLNVLPKSFNADFVGGVVWPRDAAGVDVTEHLGVLKYEKNLPACLQGMAKGLFPTFIPKTDQERIQNIFHTLTQEQRDDVYEVTLKLDGSSATYYVKDGETGVCSRNLELKLDEGNAENSFVKKFLELDLHAKLKYFYERTGRSIAIQGELYGSGINGNWEGLSDHRYNVFDVFDIDAQAYLDFDDVHEIADEMGLEVVPYIDTMNLSSFESVDNFLAFADRGSIYNKVAEGVVFVSLKNPAFSFKVINNDFLIGGGE
jgi:RNA ligase (TIGR02306 family)